MKKVKILLISLMAVLLFSTNVYATCNSEVIEELREWATKAEVKFTETSGDYKAYASQYAYFLSVTPAKDDIKVEVIDQYGNKAEATKYEDINLYAVGCYTNLEEETYTVNVYAKCSNELLKSMKYTVPRLNRMIKNDVCEKYPDHELCQTFTNATKNMTEEEFKEKMEKYDKSQTEESTVSKLLDIIKEYGIYILIPFLLITLFYVIKVQEFKKNERKK